MGLNYKREVAGEQSSVCEALLLATMYVVGSPVEVHIRDGSIYSGTFHTASVDGQYDVVLKGARLIKKGSCVANVCSGSVIPTLVIHSSDLVQIVAKGVSMPAEMLCNRNTTDLTNALKNGSTTRRNTSYFRGTKKGIILGSNEDIPAETSIRNNEKTNPDAVKGLSVDKMVTAQDERGPSAAAIRYSSGSRSNVRKQYPSRSDTSTMKRVDRDQPFNQRGTTCTEEKSEEETLAKKEENGNQENGKTDLNGDQFSDASSSVSSLNVSRSTTSHVSNSTESLDSRSSISLVSSNSSLEIRKCSKDSKLNPAAKAFVPSSSTAATPILSAPSVANMTHFSTTKMSFSEDFGTSPFVSGTPLPAKTSEQNGTRMQSHRYDGHDHTLQPTTAYFPPNSGVMIGRLGQLVYFQPPTQDLVHNAVAHGPLLNSTNVHYPKPQGMVATQTTPVYLPSPYIGVAQQQAFLMPTHLPIMQPQSRLIPVQSPALGLKFT